MKRYLYRSLPDYFLCLMMTAGLGIHIFQGFLLPAALSENAARLLLIAGALDIPLFLAAHSRRSALLGVLAGTAAAICAVAALAALGIPVTESADPEANAGLWYLLSLSCALLVFLLTRTPLGTGVLFTGGALCLALLRLLEYQVYPWALVLFLCACGAAFLCRQYETNAGKGKRAPAPMLAWACALAAAAMLTGTALWWTAVRPLTPPTQSLELVTQIMSVEVLERLGVAAKAEILDPDASSQTTGETRRLTSSLGEEEDLPQETQTQQTEGGTPDDASDAASNQKTEPNSDIPAAPASYDSGGTEAAQTAAALGLLALTALAALFPLRRHLLRRRFANLPPKERTIHLYHWTLKRFKLLGIPPISSDTPLEYAKRIQEKTKFLDIEDANWTTVTQIFTQTCYADQSPSPEDLAHLEKFLQAFRPNCRRMLGGKYLFLAFFLQ